MEITINDLKIDYYFPLENYLKNNSRKILKLSLHKSIFDGKLINDIIIIRKYKYCWVLKGCEVVNYELNRRTFMLNDEKIYNTLTLSYKEKVGSTDINFIDSEIRDWRLKKIGI